MINDKIISCIDPYIQLANNILTSTRKTLFKDDNFKNNIMKCMKE